MYYGGMNSLNEMAALADGEAAMAGMGQLPIWNMTVDAAIKNKAARDAKPSVWTPEMVSTIGQTITKGIQDVGSLNIQRIYAQKGLMVPDALNAQAQAEAAARAAAGRQAPWPAWSKWLIVGGAVLLAGTLVYKATKK